MEIGSSKNLTPSVNELSSEVLEAGLASICGLSSRRVVAVWTATLSGHSEFLWPLTPHPKHTKGLS